MAGGDAVSHNHVMTTHRPNLKHRELVGELMDDPSLPEAQHVQALRGLRRINAISRTAPTLFHTLRKQLGSDPSQPRRILDVACGDGDNAVQLARLARRHALPWQVAGCDISHRSIALANEHAAKASVQLDFFQADALSGLDTQGYDAVINSLFLHHLEDEKIIALLGQLTHARHVVISDLIRSRRAYATTAIGVRLLSRSPIVHTDGPLSVRAALTPNELMALAKQAGMHHAVVQASWPMRQLLMWSKPI